MQIPSTQLALLSRKQDVLAQVNCDSIYMLNLIYCSIMQKGKHHMGRNNTGYVDGNGHRGGDNIVHEYRNRRKWVKHKLNSSFAFMQFTWMNGVPGYVYKMQHQAENTSHHGYLGDCQAAVMMQPAQLLHMTQARGPLMC